MKKIIEFLEANGIEYRRETYGNPYYYNDDLSIDREIIDLVSLNSKLCDMMKK